MTLIEKLKNPFFLEKLNANKEVGGFQAPDGRITYNKVVDKKSFSIFTDIVSSIVPIDIIIDPNVNTELPSIANTLKSSYEHVYPIYLFLNATQDEYMDYEDEEDQENMDLLLEELDDLPLKTAIIGVTVQKSDAMQSAHASAFIVWKSAPNKYKFAFYDPLSHKKGNKNYDFAERAFVSSRFTQKIEFINLSDYCFHKIPEEYHCSQYIINAEYCYVYSVYFLYKWISFGAKLHRATFKKTIKSTYIVDPVKLTRADNKDSMIYRVVMMAFVCTTFLKYLKSLKNKERKYILDSSSNVKRIRKYLKEFKQNYGFDLVAKDDY